MHRDVAPDNILMLYDRSGGNYLEQVPRPVLLDIGAARRVVADAKQNLSSRLKTGYSPVEQYDNRIQTAAGAVERCLCAQRVALHRAAG